MNGLWVVSVVAHAYVALRLLPGVLAASGAVPAAMLAVLLVLSAGLVPLALRRRRGKRTPDEIRRSDMLAWASLTLMGLFSSLFVLTLLRDVAVIVLLLARLAGLRVTDHWLDLSASGVVAAALLVTLAGFYNARKAPRVKTVDIPLKDLPPALQGFKIAQISDMHIGPTIKRPAMKYVVARINQLQVDVVAITGDLVDGNVYELSRHVAPLAGLRSSHGTFFVTGNHEYYSGVHPWLKYLPSLGVRVLLNEHVIILHKHAPIVIAGVTDFSAASYDTSHRTDVALHHRRAARGGQGAARAPAAQRRGRRAGGLRPAAVRPHPWRPVPAVELLRALPAAVHRRPAPRQGHAGLREPRHRLLGAAQALRVAVGDHAAAPGRADRAAALKARAARRAG